MLGALTTNLFPRTDWGHLVFALPPAVVQLLLLAPVLHRATRGPGARFWTAIALVLVLVASVRELLGSGSLLGVPVLVPRDAGGWYEPAALLLLPPSAFFLIGGLVWAVRSWKTQQVEAAEPVPEAAAPEPVR